ncbi:hypothetical protein V6N11_066538 [Hibiscus sabdariffa]|uniref:Uncharacterized protein n=1 Tax=Hibiscus sabdariffa TaxID=183260 RepID=A0ABR1ZUZ5_9ROSI
MQGHGAGHKGTLRTLPNARRIVVHHGSMAMHNTHGTDPVTGFGATWRRQAQLHGVLLTRQRRNKPPSRSQNDCTNWGRTVAVGRCSAPSPKNAIEITQPRGPKQRPISRCKISWPEGLHKRRRTSKKGKRLKPEAVTHDAPVMPWHAKHRGTNVVANMRSSSRHTAEHVEKKREYKSTKTGDKQPYFNSKERVGREAGAAAERMKEREVEKEERILERN